MSGTVSMDTLTMVPTPITIQDEVDDNNSSDLGRLRRDERQQSVCTTPAVPEHVIIKNLEEYRKVAL